MPEPSIRASAEPITAVIAERVRVLRETAGMNQAELAEAMLARGVPWKRATVVNLEKRASSSRGAGSGGRDSITVQELLALALVLEVPPIMLLADPRHVESVPVADGIDLPAWDALLWLTGAEFLVPDTERAEIPSEDLAISSPDGAWGFGYDFFHVFAEARLIRVGLAMVDALAQLQRRETIYDPDDADDVARTVQREDGRHRAALQRLAAEIGKLKFVGAPLPSWPAPLVKTVQRRAAELDVDLPDLGA